MSEALRPISFAITALTVVDLGPLRTISTTSFTAANGEPANLFLLMGPNGSGKTTILDGIYTAMRLLGARVHDGYGLEGLDRGDGGLQLDALVELDDGARTELFLLSIVAGKPGLLKNWRPEELPAGVRQIVLSYQRRALDDVIERSSRSDPEAIQFADAVLEQRGAPPLALFDAGIGCPTVLYFRSDRSVVRPTDENRAITPPSDLNYAPAHCFGVDSGAWAGSIENLFIWFAWLDDGREEAARTLVNQLIFRDGRKHLDEVDRQNLTVPVVIEGAPHRLDQLSSGERQLVQLLVRTAAHMTGPTIVLIDESEQHLHLVMRRRLMTILKDWVKIHHKLTFILTSHHLDTLRVLQPKLEEDGLRKGGALVKPPFRMPE